jgi:hypothetical protein
MDGGGLARNNGGWQSSVDTTRNVTMDKPITEERMRRDVGGVATFTEIEAAVRDFWWKKTPAERLAHGEELRQWNYQYDPTTTRLSRSIAGVRRYEG